MHHLTATSIFSVLIFSGCLVDDVEHPELGDVEAEIVSSNGISLNGISLNGISLNGISLNGISLNGISLNGISLNGISLNGVSVKNTTISGVRSGAAVSGAGMVGSTMSASLSTGASLTIRLDGVKSLSGTNADIKVHTFSYGTTTGWKPLCAGANEAIAFPGAWNMQTIRHQWDANLFTLACRGATFAKCYELGYKGDSKIDTYHQACIRALRADYCGDGTSYTVNGTAINIFDNVGLQADTESWPIEANWTPDGATCIDAQRVLSLTGPGVPECVKTKVAVTCSRTSWGSAIIRTEID